MMSVEELRARVETLETILSDAVCFMLGGISGPAQRDGIVREAVEAGVCVEPALIARAEKEQAG